MVLRRRCSYATRSQWRTWWGTTYDFIELWTLAMYGNISCAFFILLILMFTGAVNNKRRRRRRRKIWTLAGRVFRQWSWTQLDWWWKNKYILVNSRTTVQNTKGIYRNANEKIEKKNIFHCMENNYLCAALKMSFYYSGCRKREKNSRILSLILILSAYCIRW